MEIETFELERIQSLYENEVEINLSDSGVHPLRLDEVLGPREIIQLTATELGYGWTHGSPRLRERIAALYQGRGPHEIIVTNGSSEANFLLAMAVLNPGDQIVLVVPNYLQIRGWARALGVEVVEVPLEMSLGWQVDPDRLEAAIGPRTRLISLCSPNNPTGAVMSADQMKAIVGVARRHGVMLHVDEVYRGVELDVNTPPSFADLYEKAVVTGGLSKAMAMPGLRIGWLAGPAATIERAWVRKDYTSITAGSLSEKIAEWVLEPKAREDILDRSRRRLRANRDVLAAWLARQPDLLSCVLPQAAGMAFVRINLAMNSTDMVHAIRREHKVLFLPGDVYGMDGHIRIGIGAPRQQLTDGLDRLTAFLRHRSHAAL